jgi:Uma2 family endonuclease
MTIFTEVAPPQTLTIEEYLAMEERATEKHEYIKGQLLPMPGGTFKHNLISTNIRTTLNMTVRQHDLPLLVNNSDTRILIPHLETFYYPDAVVIMGAPAYYAGRKDVVTNPLVIIEASSPSTVEIDRARKFMDHTALPSLKAYLLVHQDRPAAHLYSRLDAGRWELLSVEGLDSEVFFNSLGFSLKMRDIYYKTEGI